MGVRDFLDKTKEVLDNVETVIDIAGDVVGTANDSLTHGKNAINRIESGETFREKARAREIEGKTDSLWSFFELLWIIIIAVTVFIIFFF